MALRLSRGDQMDYNGRWNKLDAELQIAIAANDKARAKRIRQAKSALHDEFALKQLPAEEPYVSKDEAKRYYEDNLTLEERIERIEKHLKIGFYSED